MADSARSPDKIPRPPLKSKAVRSNKISGPSPGGPPRPSPPPPVAGLPDDLEDLSDRDIDHRRVPSAPGGTLPRSHTSGHLPSKSQDRRRKPSELSIRQRSQSASQTQAVQVQPPSRTALTTSSTPKPPPPSFRPNNTASDATTLNSNDGSESTGGHGSDRDSRRPIAMRSTSAIAGKHSLPFSSSSTRQPSIATSSSRSAPKGQYTPFPPLQDPKTAPDVPPAPSSGMYWSRAPVSGAPHTSLRAHTTTLVGSNIFVFGGCDSRACFNELYVFDADAFYWSVPHVTGEIPVPLRAMTCTAVGKKLVIFGGGDGPAYYNDIYVLDTTNFRWHRPKITGERVPSKRRAHTACLYKNGIYIFGGGDGVRALNDVWRLDVSDMNKMSWKLVSGPERIPPPGVRETRPKPRGYHTANMVGSKLIIFGGSDGGECFNDVWVYDVDAHIWKAVSIPQTFRRLSHTATLVGSYLFVIGGHDGNEYSNDVLLLNLVTMTWDRRRVYGLPPSGRGYHGTVLYDSRLFVIGGFDGSEVFSDVWMLELAVHAYYSQISHFTIEV
ncbi:kelch domain-containing protein [Colletotrichum graminicola]|uniref:Kelch domain-containing protein n=1 Tax=Colletotrichum graminicola (strain M1.001 / M2 / FGSC 10212) TaxID=645133 RepID=E3Q3F2_COLGM|nr:kelch domain-containing protein [Colletotrichum graminicola M1.001]EFQ25554.1 kelch domain-containing protein [Colletotrichum graminicola M1.001]WDK11154.1 kelch domain-containing protein [Colletotrichum graminicola]